MKGKLFLFRMTFFITAIILVFSFIGYGALACPNCSDEVRDNEINCASDSLKEQEVLSCKLSLYEETLNYLAPCTPEAAADLWAKGIKSRNGILQYSMMNSQLKQKFKEEMVKNKNLCWITGTSSPWVENYKIISSKKIDNTNYQYIIKFQWVTSAGPAEPSENKLIVGQEDGKWRVKEIK